MCHSIWPFILQTFFITLINEYLTILVILLNPKFFEIYLLFHFLLRLLKLKDPLLQIQVALFIIKAIKPYPINLLPLIVTPFAYLLIIFLSWRFGLHSLLPILIFIQFNAPIQHFIAIIIWPIILDCVSFQWIRAIIFKAPLNSIFSKNSNLPRI